MASIYNAIGQRIREMRLAQGLTQGQLAEKASISVAFLSFLELGNRKGSLQTYHNLARALGLELSQFFASFEEKGRPKRPLQYSDPRIADLSVAESQAVIQLVKTLRHKKTPRSSKN